MENEKCNLNGALSILAVFVVVVVVVFIIIFFIIVVAVVICLFVCCFVSRCLWVENDTQQFWVNLWQDFCVGIYNLRVKLYHDKYFHGESFLMLITTV